MSILSGAAKRHRQIFEWMVNSAGVTVTVRMPPLRSASTSSRDKVLGKKDTLPEGLGVEHQVKMLWSTDYSLDQGLDGAKLPARIAAVGRVDGLLVVGRTILLPSLIDPTRLMGRTIFDTAKDVTYGGDIFLVKATERTGLAPEGPYILWVGLRKAGE